VAAGVAARRLTAILEQQPVQGPVVDDPGQAGIEQGVDLTHGVKGSANAEMAEGVDDGQTPTAASTPQSMPDALTVRVMIAAVASPFDHLRDNRNMIPFKSG